MIKTWMILNQFNTLLSMITDKSVFIVTWPDWEKLVIDDGEPVRLTSLPQPLSGLSSMASNVIGCCVVGSLINNPGIDVVRKILLIIRIFIILIITQ